VLQRTKNLSAISGDFGWLDLGTIPELSKINENLVKSSVNIS
jgi:mannose-1-phosphate guanylyltransferase